MYQTIILSEIELYKKTFFTVGVLCEPDVISRILKNHHENEKFERNCLGCYNYKEYTEIQYQNGKIVRFFDGKTNYILEGKHGKFREVKECKTQEE